MQELQVGEHDHGSRLDVFLANILKISRTQAQERICHGLVTLQGKAAGKGGIKVSRGDQVTVADLPQQSSPLPSLPQKPLQVLFENSDCLILNKPPSVVSCHDGNHPGQTLAESAAAFLQREIFQVHRLDKDTSGVILFAKNSGAQEFFQKQFAERKVEKKYLALVHGHLKNQSGTIDAPIARSTTDRQKMEIAVHESKGRPAITHFQVLESLPLSTLAQVKIDTGRTHQIRVHFAAIGHSVVGDEKYCSAKAKDNFEKKTGVKIPRIFLHAASLKILLPGKLKLENFSAPLPEDLHEMLAALRC